MKRIFNIVGIMLVIAFFVFLYLRYFTVFAEGTKAGVLNTFQKKGYIFKTWEGMIIQSGFKANVQSNEFEFSVTDERIAKKLEENSGKEVNLHYKRYFGSLPWRGMSTYIIDSIYEIRNTNSPTVVSPQ
ncbi:MAG: hypothetical protein KF781_06055 [Chitinophagaceae bacterium]|nr:hypothetical protein [Chitinophagaceae bacterium]MCW5906041.1 hypothetical protein [Chitinophagaceae bacterium]